MMKSDLTERLSNLVAWAGFASFFGIFLWIIVAVSIWGRSLGPFSHLDENYLVYGLIAYVICGCINYLIVGNMRLLPWKDIE